MSQQCPTRPRLWESSKSLNRRSRDVERSDPSNGGRKLCGLTPFSREAVGVLLCYCPSNANARPSSVMLRVSLVSNTSTAFLPLLRRPGKYERVF
jgi:hypothetical protein